MVRFSQSFIIPIAAILAGCALFVALFAHAQQNITEIGGYQLMVQLPAPPTYAGVTPADPNTLAGYVRFLYLWFMGIVAISAAIMVVVGGVRYMVSAGNPGRAQDAIDQIQHALLGLIVVLGSYLILNTINPSLVNLGGTELTKIDKAVSQTYTNADTSSKDGYCWSKSASSRDGGLGGGTCENLGDGWLTKPDACADCAGDNSCCVCTKVGEECVQWYSCVKVASEEGGIPEGDPNPFTCGPYRRPDCKKMATDAAAGCQQSHSTCVPGRYCGDNAGQAITDFQITNPVEPTGGAPATPICAAVGNAIFATPTVPITIEGPEDVAFVLVTVKDAVGATLFTKTETAESGTASVFWNLTAIPSGNIEIKAQGMDINNKNIDKAVDSVKICFDCNPVIAVSAAPLVVNGVAQATQCAGQPNTFAVGPSGSATLVLSATGQSRLGYELESFQWKSGPVGDTTTPLSDNPTDAKAQVSFTQGSFSIEVSATDKGGGCGYATEDFTIVPAC